MEETDVIIVGSGIASLQLANHLRRDLNVIVITKSAVQQNNSSIAQGGMAAALGKNDHPYSHYVDTLEAGRHINHSESVMQLTREAPKIVQELLEDNCPFDLNEQGSLHLGREGSHSLHRIVHAGGDQTGKRIMNTLTNNLSSNIHIHEHEFVYELLVNNEGHCYGIRSKEETGTVRTYTANHVVLSTGGCGQIYSLTSNATPATGDGIALAYSAGAELIDMEFIQFHPTMLYCNRQTKGLISEAVRGEGAQLLDNRGNRIMQGIHPLGDLAPRHVVSQTIFKHLSHKRNIFLDLTPIKEFEQRFPTITSLCKRNGIDVPKSQIPVAPGCHFIMGGVRTDQLGRTNIKGLYAIGEVANTGVHGANRLASNSLLEGLVYGKRLAQFINKQDTNPSRNIPRHFSVNPSIPSTSLPDPKDIKSTMMQRVGIVRTENSLRLQKEWIESFDLDSWCQSDFALLTIEEITVIFMLRTAWLITCSALERKESRGGHFREDYPIERNVWQDQHIIQKGKNYEYTKTQIRTRELSH